MSKISSLNDSHIGKLIRCRVGDKYLREAKVFRQGSLFYLFQNTLNGSAPDQWNSRDFHGYKHSYCIGSGTERSLKGNSIKVIYLINSSQSYIPFL